MIKIKILNPKRGERKKLVDMVVEKIQMRLHQEAQNPMFTMGQAGG